jgi:LCP family protein required for cell wall assembly
MSHRASLLARGYQDHHLDSPRVRFRRALVLCLLTVVVPGSAQLMVGNRWVGRVALTIWLGLIAGGGYLIWKFRSDRAAVLGYLTDSDLLMAAKIAMVTLVVGWIGLLLDAWRLGSPRRLTGGRSAIIAVLNLAIVIGVAGSTAYASQLMTVQRDVVKTVFKATATSEPLKGRYNILLLGSDSGKGRTGVRPDSMTVASIDTSTGRTVLVSLPRNLQNVPFPEDSPMRELYPYGYNCGSECLLNAVHTAAQDRKDLYPGSDDPGLDATIDAIEGVTGLKINYHVMVNLKGFRSLVDAVGGVTMDIKQPIAMFGKEDFDQTKFIEPGERELDGSEALWYARSRVQSDDYTRMGRQKCLMAAMLDQLSPQTVLLNATDIAKSGKELLSTNIPAKELGQFADLALRSRGEKIASVSLVPPEVNTVTPDFEAIQTMIQDAIDESEKTGPAPTSSASEDAEPGPSATTPSAGATTAPEGRAANQTDDVDSAC